jgi:hypothetical protein
MSNKPMSSGQAPTGGPADDVRITRARKVLDDTATGHDDYGHAVGQVLELRSALAGLLTYVNETPARLDRIGRTVADLAENRDEEIEVLRLVRNTLEVKIAEQERLTRLEAYVMEINDGVTSLRDAVAGAVEQEMRKP